MTNAQLAEIVLKKEAEQIRKNKELDRLEDLKSETNKK